MRLASVCPVRLGLVLLLLIPSGGCRRPLPPPTSEESAGPPWFADVTAEVGLNFIHDAGPIGEYRLPQIVGSGAALLDFDNDGRLDIYLLNNGGPTGRKNCLLHQGADGRFTDVSAGSGLDIAAHGMGVAVGDINNDGWPDLVVTQYVGLRLFLNNGNGAFTDVTAEAGLDSLLWGTSASFFDYDRDGWLDLVVVSYADYDPTSPCYHPGGHRDYCPPTQFGGSVAKLYRNRGHCSKASHGVRFDDVTLPSGLGRLPCYGLGVVCADFDGDGWPDIFVANDQRANRLWINRRDGTFAEEAVPRGLAYNGLGRAQANMGVALGDVDGDGLFDLFVTHLTDETHTLWRQGPRGRFQDGTIAAGLTAARWRSTGWGTALLDFDHNGTLDLALVSGRVIRAGAPAAGLDEPWGWYAERNQLFAGEGAGRFRDVSPANPAFCGSPGVYRGLAYGDFDNDGAVDLLVTTLAGRVRLFRNVAPKSGHWLRLRVFDPALRRDAFGAEITVRCGGQRWTHWLNPGSSYLCSNEPWAHFGLGPPTHVDGIEVLWPDGCREEFPGCAADGAVVLRRGEGKVTR